MKLLAVSDEPAEALWDYYTPERTEGCDLIISCGDLPAAYLSFLVTMANRPLLYVHGNHDTAYLTAPPEGCVCVDDALVTVNGWRILGLGGCLRYGSGPFQYTEQQMLRRIRRLGFALRRAGGVDLVVCHAPPRGLGDLEDPAHRGFESLLRLIARYHPALLLHGHVHTRYVAGMTREHELEGTRIVNVCERTVLELPDRDFPPQRKYQVTWYTRHKKGNG